VASLPRKVIRSVPIKKVKFNDKQRMCLYVRERRHDIYTFTGYFYCTLDRYITQFLIYSSLPVLVKEVLA
jgi:hypothetical protein